MTILASDLRIGHLAWSIAENGNGHAAKGGCIFDADEDTVYVLDDRASDLNVAVWAKGAKRQHSVRHAAILALPIRDIGSVQEIGKHGMHEWAKAAWLEAGMRRGLIDDTTLALVRAGLTLQRESGVLRG